MSDTSQKDIAERIAGTQNKDQGKALLNAVDNTNLRAYLLYIPFTFLSWTWISLNVQANGITHVMPAFCLPSWCYPAMPSSLIILTVFTLLLVPRWGWNTLIIMLGAATTFDLVTGGLYALYYYGQVHWPITFIQVSIASLPFLLRPKIKLNKLLVVYLMFSSSGAIILLNPIATFAEPVILSVFCAAYYLTVQPRQI